MHFVVVAFLCSSQRLRHSFNVIILQLQGKSHILWMRSGSITLSWDKRGNQAQFHSKRGEDGTMGTLAISSPFAYLFCLRNMKTSGEAWLWSKMSVACDWLYQCRSGKGGTVAEDLSTRQKECIRNCLQSGDLLWAWERWLERQIALSQIWPKWPWVGLTFLDLCLLNCDFEMLTTMSTL